MIQWLRVSLITSITVRKRTVTEPEKHEENDPSHILQGLA